MPLPAGARLGPYEIVGPLGTPNGGRRNGAGRADSWHRAPDTVADRAERLAGDSRIALRVTTIQTWFWPAAILDPRTGNVEFLPGASTMDMLTLRWDDADRLVTVAKSTRGTLWRFQPIEAR